jgi:hypothetical protein
VLHLTSKSKSVRISGKALKLLSQPGGDGYMWKALDKGGVLTMKYSNGADVVILQK